MHTRRSVEEAPAHGDTITHLASQGDTTAQALDVSSAQAPLPRIPHPTVTGAHTVDEANMAEHVVEKSVAEDMAT